MRTAAFAIVWAALAAALAAQEAAVSGRAVLDAAARYVAAYQQQLRSIIADEVYSQTILSQVPPEPDAPRTRMLAGEVFFMFAGPGDGWMTIRDVATVDGRPLENRTDVHAELRRLPAAEVARAFKAHNSRFNLGRTFRNFNEPTLGLLVLADEHRHRFSFDRQRVERTADATVVVLTFRERLRPTLIRDLRYGPVYARGELAIEAGSGRVRRTMLSARIGPTRLELTTTYAPNGRLDMWLPASFREHYEVGTRPQGLEPAFDHEEILCEAVYANYRRFETSIRVK